MVDFFEKVWWAFLKILVLIFFYVLFSKHHFSKLCENNFNCFWKTFSGLFSIFRELKSIFFLHFSFSSPEKIKITQFLIKLCSENLKSPESYVNAKTNSTFSLHYSLNLITINDDLWRSPECRILAKISPRSRNAIKFIIAPLIVFAHLMTEFRFQCRNSIN